MGTYKKVITAKYAEPPNAEIKPIKRDDYLYFEIKRNTKVVFSLEVLKASNEKATKENVYWVAQINTKFKSNEWLDFVTKTKAGTKPQKRVALHTFLNNLNIGTKHQKKYLEDGSVNKDFKHFTAESTKGIGKKYFPANPYEDRLTKRDDSEAPYGDFSYTVSELGAGIWLEGINFYPEFGSQGAFIIAVDQPQIVSFFVEKRHKPERIVKAESVIKKDTTHVAQELVYGDIMDLHLRLHNVFDYLVQIEVFCDGKSMDEDDNGVTYVKYIELADYQDKENPSKNYNLSIIDELVADIRWASKTNHNPGKDTESSLKEYTLKLTLEPTKSTEDNTHTKDTRPTLKREVDFTVNYKGDFSLEEQEHKYVAQVVKVHQPPLISQSFESCKYTSIKLTVGKQDPFVLLKEEKNGAISGLCADNKTPYLEFVAGNHKNKQNLSIEVDSDVKSCVEDISHVNNVFNTSSIEVYDYTKKREETVWGKLKAFVEQSNIFENVQPFEEILKSDKKLHFKAAYPYNAFSEDTFLLRYLSFQLKPVALEISVQSCRYVRTPMFLIYPDVVWVAHLNYNPDKILYYNSEKVALVEGHANYMSHIAAGADWLNNKFKPFIEGFLKHAGSKEALDSWESVQGAISEFVEGSTTIMALGFHAKYDNAKIINYSEKQPYKFTLNYFIFKMVLVSIALDVLLIYLTRGKVAPGLAKTAKTVKDIKKQFKKFKDKYNLSFELPKVSVNFAIYKAQQAKFGEIGTIFEYNLKADPLLKVASEYKFKPKYLPEALRKFELKAVVKGKIAFDVNIKYNTYTGNFTLTNNDKHQKGGSAMVLKDGDILQLDGSIAIELEADTRFKKEFELWNFLPVDVEASANVELNTAFGITRRFGVHATRGPYLEDILFFQGLKGTYKQNVNIKIARRKTYGSSPKNQKKSFTLFENKAISLGPNYLFEMFSKSKTQ